MSFSSENVTDNSDFGVGNPQALRLRGWVIGVGKTSSPRELTSKPASSDDRLRAASSACKQSTHSGTSVELGADGELARVVGTDSVKVGENSCGYGVLGRQRMSGRFWPPSDGLTEGEPLKKN